QRDPRAAARLVVGRQVSRVLGRPWGFVGAAARWRWHANQDCGYGRRTRPRARLPGPPVDRLQHWSRRCVKRVGTAIPVERNEDSDLTGRRQRPELARRWQGALLLSA